MARLRNLLTGFALAAGVSVAPFLAGSAGATTMCGTCIPFDFNYSLGSVTNAGQLNATDPSYIDQHLVSGVPNGAFDEQGALQFTTYNHATGGGNLGVTLGLPGVDNNNTFLYLIYNISGSLTIPNLTFTGGTFTLYTDTQAETLDANGLPSASATAVALASFDIVGGGATVALSNGALTVSAETLDAVQTSGAANLFTTTGGVDLLGLSEEIAFAHVTSSLTFTPCPETIGGISGSQGCTTASSEAQVQVSTVVPEPASLGLLGGALTFFGFVSARRRRRQV